MGWVKSSSGGEKSGLGVTWLENWEDIAIDSEWKLHRWFSELPYRTSL